MEIMKEIQRESETTCTIREFSNEFCVMKNNYKNDDLENTDDDAEAKRKHEHYKEDPNTSTH